MVKKNKQTIALSPDERKIADLIDARNCLDVGFRIMCVYANIRLDLFGKDMVTQFSFGPQNMLEVDYHIMENLDKQYVKLSRLFHRLQDKYAELKGMGELFSRFGVLRSVDEIMDWANEQEIGPDMYSYGGDYLTKKQVAELDCLIDELNFDVNHKIGCGMNDGEITLCKEAIRDAEALDKLRHYGYFSEYWVTRGEDGADESNGTMAGDSRRVFINIFYELGKKINDGMEPDIFFKMAFQHEEAGDMPFEYSGRGKRAISQLIDDVGMKGILRYMFFRGSTTTQVCFRSRVSRECLENEGINRKKLRELDIELVKAGAKLTKYKN